MEPYFSRRDWLHGAMMSAGGLLLPAEVWATLAKTPGLTEGPFYPRELPLDDDNDLTQVKGRSGVAAGIVLDLAGRVVDTEGRPVANAMVEIWQCNAHGRYQDSRDANPAALDPNFQGFGKFVTDAEGGYRFRTIKPVAYPGRTPHIHFKVKSREFRELTTQMFVAGEPGNERDGIWRSIRDEALRKRMTVELRPATPDSGAKLSGDFEIVVG